MGHKKFLKMIFWLFVGMTLGNIISHYIFIEITTWEKVFNNSYISFITLLGVYIAFLLWEHEKGD